MDLATAMEDMGLTMQMKKRKIKRKAQQQKMWASRMDK